MIVATRPFHKPYIPSIADKLNHSVFQLHSSQYRNPAQLIKGTVLVVSAENSGVQSAEEIANEREVYLLAGHKIKFFPLELLGKSIFWWFKIMGILKANKTTQLGRMLQRQPYPIFGLTLKQKLKRGTVILKPRMNSISDQCVTFEDHSVMHTNNIIWATGFYSDYSWIQIKNVVDQHGKLNHSREVSNVPGLFFIDLPWQYSRKRTINQSSIFIRTAL